MWREMARIICEVRPRFVFVENSPMLTSRGLGRVLGDLASMGFDARWGVLGAADIGANHQRDRIWIVARQMGNTHDNGQITSEICKSTAQRGDSGSARKKQASQLEGSSEQYAELADSRCESKRANQRLQPESEISIGQNTPIICGKVSDSTSLGQSGQGQHEQHINSEASSNWKANIFEPISTPDFWAIEPNVGRVVNGMASRVDRLKAIGNGQVPLCAATAWRILNDK
jgi:DNA (cytosine-5)-methyltransferase 1